MPVERFSRRRALLTGAAGLAAAGGFLLRPGGAKSREDEAARATRLGAAQGIRIGFGDPATFYTPPYRPEDAKVPYVEMTAAEPAAIAPALDGVEAALAQYPSGFMKKLIDAIFICGRMTIEGAPAGGTYGPAWVLLAAPLEIGAASITLTCRLGVHHELSSFVYIRGDLAARWAAMLPEGWDFASSSAGELARASGAAPPEETGFLSAYGATSPENDFNVYAEKMTTEMDSVMRIARRCPRVRQKAELVRKSYAAIDPRMDEAFKQLGMD